MNQLEIKDLTLSFGGITALNKVSITVKRGLEEYTEWVTSKLPALVTVTSDINIPRYPALYNIESACDGSKIRIWNLEDLKIPQEMLGLNASPTMVKEIFEPVRGKQCEVIPGNENEMASGLIGKLKGMNLF